MTNQDWGKSNENYVAIMNRYIKQFQERSVMGKLPLFEEMDDWQQKYIGNYVHRLIEMECYKRFNTPTGFVKLDNKVIEYQHRYMLPQLPAFKEMEKEQQDNIEDCILLLDMAERFSVN